MLTPRAYFKYIVCAAAALFFFGQSANSALPKFLGGSGFGVGGNKASLDDKYPTYWDNLMKNQSHTNMYQGVKELSLAKYSAAEKSFAKAVVKNPDDPFPHIFLGIALYWQGQVDQAMAEYRAALKLAPDNPHAHQLLGISYAWKGDINSALESFKKTIELDPNRADSQMNIGSTYAALGDYEEALFHFRNAVRLDKTHPLYHYQLGSIYEVMGRDSQAEDSFKKALRLYPDYEEAMLALAVLYEKQNSLVNAEINYKKALKTKPGDSVARFRLANLLAREGRKNDAVDILGRAFLISPLSDEGLALSLSYTGAENEAVSPVAREEASAKKDKNKKNSVEEETGGPQSANKTFKLPPSNKQLENFKKRLERIPADRPLTIDLEIHLEPKLSASKIEKSAPAEGQTKNSVPIPQTSLLQASVEAADKQALTRSFSRSFALRPSTEDDRKEYLERIFSGLNAALENAAKDYNVQMSIRGGGAVSDTSVLKSRKEANTKAAYNPYMVGNDMGLWVAGKGWIKYIKEVGEEAAYRLKSGDSRDYLISGLSALALGDGKEALETFAEAYSLAAAAENKKLQELALLGQGTAYIILGAEDAALKQYEAVLSLNPENKIALENKTILTSEK